MINQVKIDGFRGLNNIVLSEMKRITLISGRNNVGKSSLLEAIFIGHDHVTPESFLKINLIRGIQGVMDPVYLWEPLFRNMDTRRPIVIDMVIDGVQTKLVYSKDDAFLPTDASSMPRDVFNQFVSSAKEKYSLKFVFAKEDYREEGHYVIGATGILRNMQTNISTGVNDLQPMPSIQYVDSTIAKNDAVVIEWLGKIELENKKTKVIDILKIIEPSVEDVLTIYAQGQTQLFFKMRGRLLPVKVAGDGMVKLLFIVLAIIMNHNSVVLIDEIENGFHYSMYKLLWRAIAQTAKENNCQVIATSHSYECISGAEEGISEAGAFDDFSFFRLEQSENGSFAHRYDGELLRYALDSNMEVR